MQAEDIVKNRYEATANEDIENLARPVVRRRLRELARILCLLVATNYKRSISRATKKNRV
jgi:hypothetical protein